MWWKARKNNFGTCLKETCSCSILHHELWRLKHLIKIIWEMLHLWHYFNTEMFFDYVWNVHINYVGKVYYLLIFHHSKEELGSNVWWLTVMMSKIWGISLNFCLLLGFACDVFGGYVKLWWNEMLFAHYVSRPAKGCLKCWIELKCRYVVGFFNARM